jgi:nitrous oxidase accessory protein NosD
LTTARFFACAIAAAVLASLVMIPTSASASGSETGVFPDRVFTVTKSGSDSSYSIELFPSFNGEWWVELTSMKHGAVVVVLKEGAVIGNAMVCSTDLSTIGSESKHVNLWGGGYYLLSFTIRGGTGTAILQEHFIPDYPVSPEPPPFETTPHAPITIESNAAFLDPMSGVIGGAGTAEDPYVIEGWEISRATDIGIKIWFTTAYVVIRNCFVHSLGYPAHGIYLFLASNVVIENCYVESCIGDEICVGSSHNVVIANNVIWSLVYIYNSYDCEVLGNLIREARVTVQYSTDFLISGNTLSNGWWFTVWFVECYDFMVVHNNFVNNELNVWPYGTNTITWDLGYPEGGNYWSDYLGQDGNGDGIGDSPYVIDALNQDNYPLMAPV